MLGLKGDASEAEPFWTALLCARNRRGLREMMRVSSYSHEDIKAAVPKMLKAFLAALPGSHLHRAGMPWHMLSRRTGTWSA